jgi:hypothetical protein
MMFVSIRVHSHEMQNFSGYRGTSSTISAGMKNTVFLKNPLSLSIATSWNCHRNVDITNTKSAKRCLARLRSFAFDV